MAFREQPPQPRERPEEERVLFEALTDAEKELATLLREYDVKPGDNAGLAQWTERFEEADRRFDAALRNWLDYQQRATEEE